jgi:transposase-like protein
VQRYAPEFIKRWNRFGRRAGRSWRVDEAYVRVRGEWTYLYRAVDKAGQTVDFRLSKRRDVEAAKAFFHKAIRHEGQPPQTITLGRVCRLPSRCARNEERRPATKTYKAALVEVS